MESRCNPLREKTTILSANKSSTCRALHNDGLAVSLVVESDTKNIFSYI